MTALSPRQLEILRLLPMYSEKEVAHVLNKAVSTIGNTKTGLYLKLGARNRTEAVMEGIRRGLIDLEKLKLPTRKEIDAW